MTVWLPASLGGSAAIARAEVGACVATWDSRIGVPGANSPINSLLVRSEGDLPVLYAGGRFTQIGGISASKIARWNGLQWSALGAGITGIAAAVHALDEFDDGAGTVLFVGGEFSGAGGAPAARLARWNGSSWGEVGGGVNGTVFALRVFDDGGGEALYVGGAFTEVGGAPALNVAKWDGAQWSSLAAGFNGTVHAFGEFDDGQGPSLYAGGEFTTSGATEVFRVARWNGTQWVPLNGGLNGPVFALAVFDDGDGPRLFAGGSFTNVANVAGADFSSIVSWDGAAFGSVGGGTDAVTRALAVFDDGSGPALYAGGTFQSAGGHPASRIARWTGAAWSTLGTGVNNAVFSLAAAENLSTIGPGLFAAGSFTVAGGSSATYVARWVDCGDVPGDVNGDGRIDLVDLERLTLCLHGPERIVQPACLEVDLDFNTFIDLRDVAGFLNLLAGSR